MCDLIDLYLQNPLRSTSLSFWTVLRLAFLLLFALYWLGTAVAAILELRSSWCIMQFCRLKLGISEDQIKWISWGEMVHRLVLIQRTTRLCLQRELTEPDIINRILRKENFLIGMVNKGVLRLDIPVIGFRRRYLMTKMIEWSLRWGLLNPMFDQNFEVRRPFRTDPAFLTRRFRLLAAVNLLLAPFLLVFLVIYILMMNAERFYHSPATLGDRSWSPYARWSLREFNEMEHQFEERLTQSQKPARDYLNQFPNFSLMHIGKLVSFVLESFVAFLLCIALMDDFLLEHGELMGHNLVWWAAVLMIGLQMARGLVPQNPVLDPDRCLEEVVRHTHYCPRLWRGHARLKEARPCHAHSHRWTS